MDTNNKIEHASVSLPKGGGAIGGIGEKFNANAVSGTGSFSVPVAMSSGREGFNPGLSLNYNSGSGNGIFGMGFDMSLPAISRKTAKGLPRYNDALFDKNIIDNNKIEPDTFLLSGAEDLVPELDKAGTRVFRDINGEKLDNSTLSSINFIVIRFRPRIEGLFARIEKVTDNGNVYWRSISKENILTVYGKSDSAKIFDSQDNKKIYKWMIEETIDDKGNIIQYEYKKENNQNIGNTSFERQRLVNGNSFNNIYIKKINYGNTVPYSRLTGFSSENR